ncbi:MAG: circadian clock protein KaiC [Armatimonadota bacterium]
MADNVSADSGGDERGQEASIPKMATGVRGLDDVLHGGIPRGRTTLLSGGPGSGKTVLGVEMLYRSAIAGESGIFISFEESPAAIRRNAASLNWDLSTLEDAGQVAILDGRVDPDAVRAGDFDIKGLLAILGGQSEAMGATLVVIDAIDGLLRLLDDPRIEREQLEVLHRWLSDQDMTSLLSVKTSGADAVQTDYDFLDYMVDCVIKLDQRVDGQVSTRRTRVLKYRGSSYERNEYPFAITERGIRLVPVTTVGLVHVTSDDVFSSGDTRIDEMLGGGLVRSSATLVSGASGTGKTSLAATIARAAAERDERVLYLQFEEAGPTMVHRMLSPGIDLRPAIEAGLLHIEATMPEALGVEEHLIRILEIIEQHDPDMVILDAITAASRMSTREAAYDFLVRFINSCRQAGISCVLTHQAQQISERSQIGAMGVSSLLDTVILLAYEENENVFDRTMLVLKSRGMSHSNRRHRFEITDSGLSIEPHGGGSPEGGEGGRV